MPLDNAAPIARLIKRDGLLPPTLEQVLRQWAVDKRSGNLQLNIKDGKILGFHENRMTNIPAHEIS